MTNEDFKHHEFEIMQEAWNVYKKYYCVRPDSDQLYWDSMISEFAKLNNKWSSADKASFFVNYIIDAFTKDIANRRMEVE